MGLIIPNGGKSTIADSQGNPLMGGGQMVDFGQFVASIPRLFFISSKPQGFEQG